MDREHIHLHMVTNTVSFLDGHKLHTTKNDLQEMKDLTNLMCESRGWKITEKGKDYHGNDLEMGHVIWKESRKNITFVNEEGKRVRDRTILKTFNLDT